MEEQIQKILQKLKFFKIPQVDTSITESTLIGVIDSSYSMSGQWPFVAQMWNQFTQNQEQKKLIVFSSSSNEIPDCQTLTSNISDYFPGGTNITSGFLQLNEFIKKQPNLENVTVLFISDGSGSFDMKQIQSTMTDRKIKINFLTVGVGSGFPTTIAMSLRNLYHTGEVNIPPLFLLEKTLDTECWTENFQQLSTFLAHKSKVTLKTAIQPFPWSQLTDKVYENSWVISENFDQIEDTEGKFQVKAIEELGILEIIEILKQWLGELQLRSLKETVQEDATLAYKIVQEMKQIVDELMKKKEKRKLTFHEKMLRKVKNDVFQDFSVLAREIRGLSESNFLNQLSEQEAAKRLAIGTQLGKYHNNAMKIRGLSVEQFQEAQEKFVKMFQEVKISQETDQEPSVISQCTQKEVLLETDFIEGIKLCPSQYTLVETLPLVGQGIKIKRIDGSMINPYLITVEDMARHHKVVDTVSIQGTENNELVLKTGDGEEESINAVIPLYTEKDQDLKPIIRSKLFDVLMTFNVMQNADTCFDNAYIALQANTLMYLLNQSQSTWRDDMLQSLLQTLEITYGDTSAFKFHNQAVLETPRTAVITEHPDIKTKCEDLSKTILHLFYHTKVNKLEDKEKIQEILNTIFCEIFGRLYPNETDLKTFFKMKNPEVVNQIDFTVYVEQVLKDFPEVMSFYCLQDIKDEIEKRLENLEIQPDSNHDFSMELDMEKVFFLKQGKYSLENLRKIEQFFLGKFDNFETMLTEQNFIIWLKHAGSNRNSKERNTSEILQDPTIILEKLTIQKQNEILSKRTVFDLALEKLEKQYKKQMNDCHRYFMPFNLETLTKELKKQNIEIDSNTYQINATSMTLSNACVAPGCPFFLKQDKRLSSHRQIIDEIPAFCKTIFMKKDQNDAEVIFQAIINEECIDKNFRPVNLTEQNRQEMLENKEKFINIIVKMRDLYKNI